MPVQITIEDNISLATMAKQKELGHWFMETPHVGNLGGNTLALMTIGLQPNLVDVNIGEKDNLFYPHQIIKNGVARTIAPANMMSTHNRVSFTGEKLCDFHTAPLRKLGLNAIPHSEWIADRKDDVLIVLEAITVKQYRNLWRRYVDCHGFTYSKTPLMSDNILDQVHKVSAPADGVGWVIPNPINILIDVVFGARETDKDIVHMLSGQSMYKYITKKYETYGPMTLLISEMYDLVVKDGRLGLPQKVQVKMVPTPVIRNFVAPANRKDLLDAKLKYYQKARTGIARVGTKFGQKLISKETKVRLQQKRLANFKAIAEHTADTCADSETGIYFTQHDLAANPQKVYIPDIVMDMTMRDMMVTAQTMQKFSR